jgi:hypothetical protein
MGAPLSQFGGVLAFGLLVAFTVGAAIRYLLRGDRGDCHCFGGALRERLSWLTFLRNTVLLTLAALAVSHPGQNLLAHPTEQLLPGVLIAAGCALVYAQAVRLFGIGGGSRPARAKSANKYAGSEPGRRPPQPLPTSAPRLRPMRYLCKPLPGARRPRRPRVALPTVSAAATDVGLLRNHDH